MGHWVEAGDGYSWVEDPVEPVAPVAPQAAPVDTKPNLVGASAGLPALVGPSQPSAAPAGLSALAGPQTPATPLAPAPVPTSSPAAASKNNFWDFSNPNLWKQSGNYLITDQTINKEDLPSDFFAKADKKTRGGVSYIYNGTTFRQNDDGTYSPSVFHDNPSWLDKAVNIVAPLAFSFVGGPLGTAAFQAAQGKSLEDIAKGAALSYLGNNLTSGISNSLVDTLGNTGANLAGRLASAEIMSGGKADLSKLLSNAALAEATGALTNTGPSASDMVEGYFAPGGEGYVSPTPNVVENQIQTNDSTPVNVSPQIAESNIYPTNNVGLDQLVQAFTNPQDLSNTPSVQVASADPASALAALQETQAPTAEQATVPTQAEQQPAVNELVKQLETTQTPQTVEQIMAAEPAPAVSQVTTPAEAAMTQVTPAAQEVATVNTPEEAATQVQDLLKQIGVGSNPEAQQAITDLLATNPAPAVNNTETTGVFQDIPADFEQPGTTQTLEQILEGEPTPAVSQVEIPATQETTPEVQKLIDEAVNNQQTTTAQDKSDVNTQTQELLNILSGGTNTGTTIEEPAVYPKEIIRPESVYPDEVYPKEVLPPEPDYPEEVLPQEVLPPEPDYPEEVLPPEPDYPEEVEEPRVAISPTEDDVQDFLDRHVLDQPEEEVLPEETVSPTEDVVQDFIDRHVLDQPDEEIIPQDTSPNEDDVQDFIDRHVLDQPEDEVIPQDTSPDEEDVQDFIDRHILDEPDEENDTSPDEEDVQDFIDRHILDEPDAENDISPDEEDVQDFIDRHILDEPPEETEDGESPTEQDVIDYVDDHPNDGEEDEDGEDDEDDEESKGGGTGKVNIGGGTKTKGGTTVTPKSTAPTKPAVDTAALKKLLAGLLANQQTQYLPGIGDVAHIKSDESLFGAIPGIESPASSAREDNYDPVSELLAQGDEEYASGGHVDDLDVEALLHILRS